MKNLIFLFLVFPLVVNAQTLFSAKIVDGSSNEPVEAAVVQCGSGYTLSEKDGTVNLKVSRGDSIVFISAIGYENKTVSLSSDRETIRLLPAAVNLQELLVKSSNRIPFANRISKIDLHLRPVRSAQELLRFVPGLFIAQHQGGGKAEQIFLRGFDIDHGTDIQITADGIPVNMTSHAHGQGYADLHFIIPELVKNIDYGKGPYYSDKGNFNTAGYVELQTRNSIDKNSIQVEAGQFNSLRALAMIGLLPKTAPNQAAFVAAEFLYSDGPFESDQHFNRFNIWAKYNAQLREKTRLFFSANLFNSRWDASGQVPQRAVKSGNISRFGSIDDTESGYTGRINFNTKLEHRFANRSLLEQQLYYSKYHFNLYSNFTFFLNDPVNGDQIRQYEGRNIYGWNSKYSFTRHAGQTVLNTSAGAGIRLDMINASGLAHTLNREILLEQKKLGNITESNFWFYADEKIEKGKWLLNAGIRADGFYNKYDDKLNPGRLIQKRIIFSPKINIQYSANERVQLYLKSGRGFHSNDTRVLVQRFGKETLPAATGADLGIIWTPVSSLLINTAFWYLKLDQEFVYVGDEGIVEAGGKTQRSGVDLAARYQVNKFLVADLNLNYAYARSLHEEKGQNYIPLAPDFTGTGGFSYQSAGGIAASLRCRLIKNRPANENNSIVARGYFITDASLSYTMKKYTMAVVTENLFNSKWNEAQFATESKLKNESTPVTELHFTPGNPFFLKFKISFQF